MEARAVVGLRAEPFVSLTNLGHRYSATTLSLPIYMLMAF